jgi:hypothetical protein
MTWLKSPWFWLIVVLLLLGVWWLFWRTPTRTSVAPASLGNRSTFGGWGGLLDSIGARFSVGGSIMTGGGGSG